MLDLTLIACVAALAGGMWWDYAHAPKAPARPATVATVNAPSDANAGPAEDYPVPPPAPKPARPVAVTTDVQAELTTAVPDMIQTLLNQGIGGLMKNYMPPDELAQMPPEVMTQMTNDPRMATQTQMLVTVLQSIQSITPTMDATGERATYSLSPQIAAMGGAPPTISFVKQNGRWYISDGP